MSRVWWHTPGRAVAAAVAATVTVVVAVTGCAAERENSGGPARRVDTSRRDRGGDHAGAGPGSAAGFDR